MKLYQVELVERDAPPHREGMRYVTRFRKSSLQAAANLFKGSSLVAIRVTLVKEDKP